LESQSEKVKKNEYSHELEFLVFQIRNFDNKNQIWTRAKETPYHFGQVNFNMSNVTFDWSF
jgi:hypothetical protein